MDFFLNNKLDFIFIITPNINIKHNNYLYHNIKIDNYYIETLIYDDNKPLDYIRNYYFTIKKILKIAIMRKYSNIMILHSNILLKNDWLNSINSLYEKEINDNNFGIIWLESTQNNYTEQQLDEIKQKQYYTHDLSVIDNKVTFTYGNNGFILSKKIFYNLYKLISENLKIENIDRLKESFSCACANINGFILQPNVVIELEKIRKYIDDITKMNDKTLIDYSKVSSKKNEQLDNYIEIYKNISNLSYNPEHFCSYKNFSCNITQYFDWIFYKYFYEDTIDNESINSHCDAIAHYVSIGYKELRYVCLDEYLYDKHDEELNQKIKQLNVQSYYEQNKQKIDEKKLQLRPIIYYIKYDYESSYSSYIW